MTFFAKIGTNNNEAARHTLGLLDRDPSQATALIGAARRMVFLKGTNSHDYKFSSAVLEDYYNISPACAQPLFGHGRLQPAGFVEPRHGAIPRSEMRSRDSPTVRSRITNWTEPSSLAIWPRGVSRFGIATVLMWLDACRTVASSKTDNRHCKIRHF